VYVWWQRKRGHEPTMSKAQIFTETIRARTQAHQEKQQGRVIDQED